MAELPFQDVAGGIRLAVRLTPRARSNGIAGVQVMADGRAALAVRVTSPPVDGEANEALIALLAKAIAAPRRDIRIQSGDTSRLKIIEIAGSPERLRGVLEKLIADA